MRLPDGRVLAYAEYGDSDGIAVLGLHGTPGTRHIFSLGDTSARKHGLRLIAPDRAGVGGSDDCPDHSLAGHIEDAVALLDHLGVEKFAVLGFSGGGPYAAEVARQESHRIRALTLVSAHVQGVQPGPGHRILMKLANVSIPVARLVFLAIAIPAVAAPNFSRFLIGPGLNRSDRQALKDREIRRCLTKGIAGVLWSGRATALEARNFYRERPSSPIALDVPVRIWHGAEDKVIVPKAAFIYSRTFPGSYLTVIPKAGHLWGLVACDQVLATLAHDLS
ncbi:MAG: alpha/beta fold hydrolase [Gammaproteobacteria bacterium]|nr:alpha/beta fold hydrolase [Gammaproteobacteria bacterium]